MIEELEIGEYYQVGESKYILEEADEYQSDEQYMYLRFITIIDKVNPIDENS